MLMALCLTTSLLLAGQTSTQTPQPVQSSGATCIVKAKLGRSLSRQALDRIPRERRSGFPSGKDFMRMAACGQTRAHRPQSGCRSVVPDGNFCGDAAFLKSGRAGRKRAVDRQCADGQTVALPGDQGGGNPLHEIVVTGGNSGCQPLLAAVVRRAPRPRASRPGPRRWRRNSSAPPIRRGCRTSFGLRLDVFDRLFARQEFARGRRSRFAGRC